MVTQPPWDVLQPQNPKDGHPPLKNYQNEDFEFGTQTSLARLRPGVKIKTTAMDKG